MSTSINAIRRERMRDWLKGGFIDIHDRDINDNDDITVMYPFTMPAEIGRDMYSYADDFAKEFEPESNMQKSVRAIAITAYINAYKTLDNPKIKPFITNLTINEIKSVVRIVACVEVDKFCSSLI